jgi:hypothetical protein
VDLEENGRCDVDTSRISKTVRHRHIQDGRKALFLSAEKVKLSLCSAN